MKRTRESAFTLVEIMIVVAIIALLAAIAIPNVLRGRVSANETTAIGNTRALMSALEMARSVNNQYPLAATWQATMYGADCAAATQPAPDFGPPSFCLGLTGVPGVSTVQGYIYTYAGAGATPGNTYTILAVPATVGTTGSRAFFADERGQVRHCVMPGTGTAGGAGWLTIDAVPAACA